MTQASTTAPTAPIVPSALNLAGFRSPAEIAAGVPEKVAGKHELVGAKAEHPSATSLATEKPADAKPKRKPAVKKAKSERKPRTTPLTMRERFNVMGMINLAPLTESDASLADRASAICSRAVSPALIASYRVQLGLDSVKELSRAQMREKLAQLERELEESKQAQLFNAENIFGGAIAGGGRALVQLMNGVANQVATDTHSDQFGTFGVLGRGPDGYFPCVDQPHEVWPDDLPKLPDPVELAEANAQAAEQQRGEVRA